MIKKNNVIPKKENILIVDDDESTRKTLAFIFNKKGYNVEFVHFHNWPFTSRKNWNKSKELVQELARIFKKKLNFHVIHHGANLVAFKKIEDHLTCVLCRRAMLREAGLLAKKLKCDALLTGDNLAQVASQTLHNLFVESKTLKLPIIRPLIGFNKQEIIDIGKKVGTYNISVGVGCDCRAVPRKPSTHADLKKVLEVEKKAGVRKLARKALKSLESEKINRLV